MAGTDRRVTLPTPRFSFGLVPPNHPTARGKSALLEANAEVWAYIEAKGWDAAERQYMTAEHAAALLQVEAAAHDLANAVEAERKARAKREREQARREREVARLPTRQRRKSGAAVRLLLATLDGGQEVSAERIVAQASALGISERTLRSAKAKLGVRSRRRRFAGPWFWSLPRSRKMRISGRP